METVTLSSSKYTIGIFGKFIILLAIRESNRIAVGYCIFFKGFSEIAIRVTNDDIKPVIETRKCREKASLCQYFSKDYIVITLSGITGKFVNVFDTRP